MDITTARNILKNHSIFDGLTAEEIKEIMGIMKLEDYSATKKIIEENSKGTDLFFLVEGTVELSKTIPSQKFILKELNPPAIFGDIAFIEEKPRAATITAVTKCSVMVLKKENLLKLANGESITQQMIANLVKLGSERLNQMTQAYIQSSLQTIQELELRNQFGKFFAFIVGAIIVSSVFSVLTRTYGIDRTSNLFNWSYLVCVLIPILVFIKRFHYSVQGFGINLNNLKQTMTEGILISMVLASVLVVCVMGYRHIMNLPQTFSYRFLSFSMLLYLPHSYLQEFIARGVIQTLLVRFLNNVLNAIILTALLFAQLHFYIHWLLALLSFLLSVLLGFIYQRHKNCLGVSIIHATLGTTAIFLGLM